MYYKSKLITALAAMALCTTVAEAKKAASTAASPAASPAATPAASAAASPVAKAPRAIPFRGTASAIDQSAKTFSIVGKEATRVFKVTDTTTVTKSGAAATLADLTDNTAVTGSYWKKDDGSLECKSLKIGGAAKAPAEKKAKSDAAASPSPSPKK